MSCAIIWAIAAAAAIAISASCNLPGPDDIQSAQDQADNIAAITESEE